MKIWNFIFSKLKLVINYISIVGNGENPGPILNTFKVMTFSFYCNHIMVSFWLHIS
jgi:hypothetical protein